MSSTLDSQGRGPPIAAFLACVLLCSCSTLGSYRTAEVAGKGKSDCGVALTFSQLAPEGTDAFGEPLPESFYLAVEAAYRYEAGDRVDLGGKVTGGGNDLGFLLDAMYQFLDGESFDGAFGVGAGSSGWEIQGGGPDGDSLRFTARDLVAFLPLTCHFSGKFSLTATPRFIKRTLTGMGARIDQEITEVVLTGAIATGEGPGGKDKVLIEVGVADRGGAHISHLGFSLQGDEPSVYWRGLVLLLLATLQLTGEPLIGMH